MASAFGTDRYPPFSLHSDPGYPADFTVDYPQHLAGMTTADVVRELTAQALNLEIDHVGESARFDELGRTSFQEVELLVAIEDRFDIEVDFHQFTRLATVRELIDMVAAMCPTERKPVETADPS